jgi:hypothetical protein
MGQIFLPENIPTPVVVSTTSVTIATTNSGLTPISAGTGATFWPNNQPTSLFAEFAISGWKATLL